MFGFTKALWRIAGELAEIKHILFHALLAKKPISATLTISDTKGKILMPATLQVGKTATALLHEWTGPNGTGSELPPVGPVSYASSDPNVATVDPTSGLITAVAPGVATITGTDTGNGLNASDVVSDTPVTAQSATLVITPI